jgi:UDP-glucose 4-epimerase
MHAYLVTGAAGFIGAALARVLLEQGHKVITIDNLSTGKKEEIPEGVIFLEGDCQDPRLIEALQAYSLEAVYHIAGQSSGEISYDNPVYDLQTNTQSTLQLLKHAVDTGCKKFIYASTMSVYGDHPYHALPVHEESAAVPKSFYGIGKLASEHYLRAYHAQYGIATAALRLFNIYGPGQNLSNMRQGMVSIFLAQALQQGAIHVRGSLDRFRDFVYIDDAVAAFLQAERTLNDQPHFVANVATGKPTSITEVLAILQKALGHEVPVSVGEGTPGDQFGIFGSAAKYQQLSGWTPTIDFATGIQKMVSWARGL